MQCVQMLPEQIDAGFLDRFDRFQEVTHCWRKQENQWKLLPIAFTEQWDDEELRQTSLDLKRIAQEGAVFAAFPDGAACPAAFAAVEGEPIGSRLQYLVLHYLYTDARFRSQGLGTRLMELACAYGREQKIEKLYISAHSSEESQRFYRRMGCVEAEEIDPHLYELEPCDCHLEIRTGYHALSGADQKL